MPLSPEAGFDLRQARAGAGHVAADSSCDWYRTIPAGAVLATAILAGWLVRWAGGHVAGGTMATERQIVMTSVERGLVKRMGQVMDERRINPDVDTFTANDMARAIRAATGVPVNSRKLGALLDRMGVTASRRDYRRQMLVFTMTLPEWLKVADSQKVSQIRMPSPTV